MTTLDTGTNDLLARTEGHVAVISFNRPEARNALSDAMYAGFDRVLPIIATDPDIRVVMITGEGGAFCAPSKILVENVSFVFHRIGRIHRRFASAKGTTMADFEIPTRYRLRVKQRLTVIAAMSRDDA